MSRNPIKIILLKHSLKQNRTHHPTPTNNANLRHLFNLNDVVEMLNSRGIYILSIKHRH